MLNHWRSRWKVPTLLWHHNGHDGISNQQPHDCLLNCWFRHKSKKTSKLHFTGLCAGNSPVTGEFPAQMISYVENVSIWWRHHDWSKASWYHDITGTWYPWVEYHMLINTSLIQQLLNQSYFPIKEFLKFDIYDITWLELSYQQCF